MTHDLAMLVALSCVFLTSNAGAQSPGSLKGAWKVVAVTAADGKVDTVPQPGLYVFSDKHYSIQRVHSARPATTGNSSLGSRLVGAESENGPSVDSGGR